MMMMMMMTMRIIYQNMIVVHTIVLVMLMVVLVEVRVNLVYHRKTEKYLSIFEGRGRGGRGHHLTSTNNRLPPSTHFVRPQPETNFQTRSKPYSTLSLDNHRHHNRDSIDIELSRTYANALLRYYGTRNGQTINSNDYGDFRISMFISILINFSDIFFY